MATQETWDRYKSPGIIESDDELRSMIKDVVDTIHNLQKMYGRGSEMVVYRLIQDYYNLQLMAGARGFSDYEHL